ncbi:MAG: DUF6785 family protein [bacterium]
MSDTSEEKVQSEVAFSKLRFLIALLLGIIGACFIWVAVPINNYFLNINQVSDSYIPEIVLAMLSLLTLCINPLLSRIRTVWRMTHRQLALVLGIWLMASVVPGTGLLGNLPYALARNNQAANTDMAAAAMYKATPLPPALFPDQMEMGKETPVSDGFLGGIKADASIPWRTWLRVLAAWAPLILGIWLMMIGLGMIVYPQWRERERLSFPLLTMYEALIETPDEGRHFAPVLRDRIFWVGALIVFLVHSFNGLSLHTGGRFPDFSLGWNLWQLFQEGVWRYSPWTLRGGSLYFILIGIVYFMPNRTSFSIWSGIVGFAVFWMLKDAYFPMFGASNPYPDFRAGAWLAYGLGILFLGRSHWLHVARSMFTKGQEGTLVRDRAAGWFFLAGCISMVAWFMWAGLSIGVSIGYLLFGVLLTLLAARVVSETGLPLFNFTPFVPSRFLSLFPHDWWTSAAVYIGGYVSLLFNFGARICAGAMMCLGVGLDRERPPREQPRVGRIFFLVLVAGIFVAGATHLWIAYRNEVAVDGKTPISRLGRNRMNDAQKAAIQFHAGAQLTPPAVERWPFLVGGIIVAAGLQACCLAFPKWPVHPIALLFMGSQVGDAMWPSIFLGWLLKTLITNYGGARGYRAARPFFLGLVMGEIFAVIVWTLVPAAMMLFGNDPAAVDHVNILLNI